MYARTLGAVAVAVYIEYANGPLVPHALFGDAHYLLLLGEGDALHHRDSHTKRHLPVCTDHSRISLFADPETRKRDCAACETEASWRRSGREREGKVNIGHAQST